MQFTSNNTNKFTTLELGTKAHNFINYLNTEFTSRDNDLPILKPISAHFTDIEGLTSIWTFTCINTLYDDTQSHNLNEYDIEDLEGIITDYLNKEAIKDLYAYTSIHITPITCDDTANPYEIIQITINIEYFDED